MVRTGNGCSRAESATAKLSAIAIVLPAHATTDIPATTSYLSTRTAAAAGIPATTGFLSTRTCAAAANGIPATTAGKVSSCTGSGIAGTGAGAGTCHGRG